MDKQAQKEFMAFMEWKNRLSEDLANNYINLIELNNKEVNEKTIIKVLDDLLLELVQEFIDKLSDNYDLEFDDFLIQKIKEEEDKKLFTVIIEEIATGEVIEYNNVILLDTPYINNYNLIEIIQPNKLNTSIFDTKYFKIKKVIGGKK